MRRTPWVLVAVISAAALLSGCGDSVGPAAAKVGSTTISRTTLDDQLSALTDNEQWMQAVDQNSEADLTSPEGTVSTSLSSAWLASMLHQAIADQVFENRDLKVTDADRVAAKQAALDLFAGQETFDRFPRWFRQDQLRRQERYAAVATTVPPRKPPTEATLRESFTSVTPSVCSTNEAILEIKVDTLEAAEAIRTELAQGADFGTVARERSQDEASSPNGGLVACRGTTQYSQLPEAMRQAVDALAIGGISGAVPLNGGFNVFTVVPWTFELARPVVERLYNDQLVPIVQEFVSDRLSKAKIWIDPRYGKLTVLGARVRIDPPVAPRLRSDPPTSSSTAPAGATGP